MAISIHKLLPPENQFLFERNPELNTIWEIPAHQNQARESYEECGLIKTESTGEIFSINLDDSVVGIIGWFEYGGIPDVLRLRYYGIVPSQRGNGYGAKAVKLLLDHLSHAAPPQYRWLSESVSLKRVVVKQVTVHFERMGFVEYDDSNYGSNAGCGRVRSLKIRIPLR
jgi:RimJ/RimL family protein N-acetyltransferase